MSTGPSPGNSGEYREGPAPSVPSSAPLSADDLIALNEEIAGLAKAGLPLDQGLSALAREMGSGQLQQVTAQLAVDMRGGCTLPQALERQGGRVPPYYAALLSAGVRSGRIGDVLGTLTLYARSLAEFRATVWSALLYPLIVLAIGVVLMLFISSVIFPRMQQMFLEFKMKLPALTEWMFWASDHTLLIVGIPVLLLIAAFIADRFWLRATPRGRRVSTRLIYSLPIVGTLLRSARLAAFTDLLGILVEQGIPLPEALRLAAEASSDPLLTQGAKRIEDDISQGIPLGQALHAQSLVPDLVVWMIGFGEKKGTLAKALRQVAQMYRRDAEQRTILLRTVLPPFLIIVLAVTLGSLFVFGLLFPFLALLDGLSGGGML